MEGAAVEKRDEGEQMRFGRPCYLTHFAISSTTDQSVLKDSDTQIQAILLHVIQEDFVLKPHGCRVQNEGTERQKVLIKAGWNLKKGHLRNWNWV